MEMISVSAQWLKVTGLVQNVAPPSPNCRSNRMVIGRSFAVIATAKENKTAQ